MLDTGSPPEHEDQKAHSVSPLSSLHASRSSTPGISAFDGTPQYLLAFSPPPLRPRSSWPQDMAIKPVYHSDPNRTGHRTKVKPIPTQETDSQVAHVESAPEAEAPQSPSQDDQPNPAQFLSELPNLLRLDRYRARKCRQIQHQLHQVHTVAAKTVRLIRTARSVQRTLAECIKLEDKHSFVNLFNALQDALTDCSETSDGLVEDSLPENADCVQYPTSFVDALSEDSRTAILDFLSRIRHDDNFVAERLANLTHRELISLLPEKGQSRSSDSVFGSSPRTSSRSSRHLGFVADGQTELLSSFEYGSPLETLIYSVRGISEPSLSDDPVTTDLWATICAKLISEQKPGSERLVPAVIDIWASSSRWSGQERFSHWMLQTLHSGSFVLEQPSKQSFRVRVQGRPDASHEDETHIEEFFTSTVKRLLDLLEDQDGPSLIPEGALKLCQAICRKLQRHSSHRQAFPGFVLTRWLFSSYFPEAIVLPEAHGLLTDHFISDNARQRLLREVASRAQKAVFDVVYSWKLGNTASPEVAQLVRSVANRFQCSEPDVGNGLLAVSQVQDIPSNDHTILPLSITDISILVNALYPQRSSTSFSDRDPSRAGLRSSASSISGFSLFQNPGTVESGHKPATPLHLETSEPSALESSQRPNVDQDPFLEPARNAVDRDLEGEQLRYACGSIEDTFANRSSSSSCWCVLFAYAGRPRLCTLRDVLSEKISVNASAEATISIVESEAANYNSCKTAIEDLLLHGELAFLQPAGSYLTKEQDAELTSCVVQAFHQQITSLQNNANFVAAHSWHRKLRYLKAMVATGGKSKGLLHILKAINVDVKQSLGQAEMLYESCDLWLRSMLPHFEKSTKELSLRAEIAGQLRDKMWYVADVRTSGPYDEARSVASALKVMEKLKRTSRSRAAPPLRHWSGPKVPTTGLHFKTDAQVLDILSAPAGHGGPNKLSDDQSRAVSTWMERNAVENLCRGEERLQKLCMEIRKAVDQVTAESSTLLSSALFAREKGLGALQPKAGPGNPFWSLQAEAGRIDLLTLQTNVPPSIDSISSSSSHPLSAKSSRDYLETRSPTLNTRSSAPFWSPVMTEARSPSSATSVGSSQTHAAPMVTARRYDVTARAHKQPKVEQLRQRATSLLLSDLASVLFREGSETDRAFWTGLGGDLSEKHLRSLRQRSETVMPEESSNERFDFELAFETLLQRFSEASNPFVKLSYLLDVDKLLGPYVARQEHSALASGPELPLRTPLLQEPKRHNTSAVADTKVNGFRKLFCSPLLRPAAIFRDLQYIAALVPSSTLESTAQGKAFWNAAVAISGLKQEIRQVLVETADSIIAYQSNNRGHGRSSSTAQQERDSATFSVPSRTPSAEDVSRYTMADAAYLLQITAKEGDAVAQRELATLYLTHPELMDHIIAPLARPRDVFREELESKWRKNQDPNRCDPATMCVAHHWMSLSSKGGDALAKEYLRQREEMDRLG